MRNWTPPLVAILRGLTTAEAPSVGRILHDAGFRAMEVPMNRPQAADCIRLLRQHLPRECQVGAGSVVQLSQLQECHAAGAEFVVMPTNDETIIRAAKQKGLPVMAGCATPSECFHSLAAGADAIKLFPAELLQPAVVRALRTVLPESVPLYPVGGITPDNLGTYLQAGAHGAGIGSALYRPQMAGLAALTEADLAALTEADLAALAERAASFINAWRKVTS